MSNDTSMRYGATRLEVPSGFENILRLISQEVIRINPDDIYRFIADLLEDLMDIREKTGLDPLLKNGALAQVQKEYAQLREVRSASQAP